MADIRIQIADTLKRLGPSQPWQIADALGLESGKVGHHLRAMLAAKELKARGASRGRTYALPDQDLAAADAPPQPRNGKKKAAAKKRAAKPAPAKKRRARRAPRPAAPRDAAPVFLPAIASGRRLACIGTDGSRHVYSPEDTLAIADVILENFDPD